MNTKDVDDKAADDNTNVHRNVVMGSSSEGVAVNSAPDEVNLEDSAGAGTIAQVSDVDLINQRSPLLGDARSLQYISQNREKFGLFTCVGVIMNSIVGSGILTKPQGAYKYTQNELVALLIWCSYGILAVLGALCYAELGTTLPLSGGDYSYINEFFGSLMGFLFQWSAIFVTIPISRAIFALTIAENLVAAFLPRQFKKEHEGEVGFAWGIRFFSMLLIVLLSVLNSLSASVVSKLNGVLFIIKLISIASIMMCGLIFMSFHGIYSNTNFSPDLQKNSTVSETAADIVMATYQVTFSYLGFNYLNFIAEEVKNPQRNLPLAIMISVPAVVAIYVFINFSYFVAIPGSTIMKTETIVHELFQSVLPTNVRPYILWLAPTMVALAVTGSLASTIMSSARIPFIGAKHGHVPNFLALVNRTYLTPTPAIAFTSMIACLYVLSGNVMNLIAIEAYIESGFLIVTITSLVYMRYKHPELKRPIKLPLVIPVLYILISTLLFFTPIFTIESKKSAFIVLPILAGAALTVLTGVPVYLIIVNRKNKPECMLRCNDKISAFVQRLFNASPDLDLKH